MVLDFPYFYRKEPRHPGLNGGLEFVEELGFPLGDLIGVDVELLRQFCERLPPFMAAKAAFALKPGVWFRRGLLLIVSSESGPT
jgi:hypothetical protein